MSDAQLPPDTVEGESLPSPRSDARAVLQFDAGPGVPDDAGDANAADHTPVIEAAADHVLPLVDLPLPDNTAQEPPEQSGEPIPLVSEPIDIPAAAPAPVEAADAAAVPDEPVVEISPIFSALDAAERAAEALLQREPPPEAEPFETGILIPRSRLAGFDEEPAVFPSVPQQLSEAPAGTSSEAGEILDAVILPDAAASPETPQHDPAAAASYEEQPRLPPEALQDAAARIAAEASATAAALENLKRLLVHKLPGPGVATRPPGPPDAGAERGAPPPIPAFRPPVQLPVAPPPMVAAPGATAVSFADYDELLLGRRGAAVGSFLAGFALSWVFGAVLYVFLNAG